MSLIGVVFGAIILAVVVYFLQQSNQEKNQKLIENNNKLQYGQWKRMVMSTGMIRPISAPLMLEKGEQCLWMEKRATLLEVRAVRHSNHSFGSIPVCHGIRLGKAFGTSESTDEWRPIAEGQLYITNRQIYFDGDKQDRKIPIGKISTVKADWSAMEISSQTRMKSMIFVGVNGMICQEIVRNVRNG